MSIFWDLLMLFFMFMSLIFLTMTVWCLKKNFSMFFNFSMFSFMSSSWDFSFFFDKFSLIFGFTVSLISMSVLNFSKSYMSSEKFKTRFIYVLLLFILSMYFLIFSSNLLFLMIGWDGLGVISYLLVIYFFSNKSNNAGFLTIMTNRLGDLLLMLSISILSMNMTWNFNIYLDNHQGSMFLSTLICLGGFTKSAQIPFSAWLPAAMAAPTPVSSLVHSSTLVTAGIYIIFRFAPILNLEMVRIFGVLTLLMAGLNALKEIDMKKIVALSTLSQLGLMVSGLGLGFTLSAFFHLILHAFFKALLFISVGNMIHLSDDYQDLRKINFWENKSSITLSFCIMSNLSLMGFPAFSGFFSKDFMLESNFFNFNISSYYWILMFLGCIFTSVYSIRFLKNIIFSDNKSKSLLFKFKEDGNFFFGGSCLFIMALSSGGWIFWILFHENISILFSAELKILMNLIIILGSLIYFFMSILTIKFNFMNWCVLHMWGLPLFVTKLMKWPMILMNKILACHSDQFVNKETLIFIDSYLSYWDIFKTKKLVTSFKFMLLMFIFMIF